MGDFKFNNEGKRQIPLGQPLSDEDRAYLYTRGEDRRVENHDRLWPPVDDDGEELELEEIPDYASMTVDELRAEVKRLNTEENAGLDSEGKKAELVARLVEYWNKTADAE